MKFLSKLFKKKCRKGASCGATCIDRNNVCQNELGPPVQKALNRKVNKKDFEFVAPDKNKIFSKIKDEEDLPSKSFKGKRVTYTLSSTDVESVEFYLDREIAGNRGKINRKARDFLENEWNGSYLEVMWSATKEIKNSRDEKQRLAAALEAKKIWKSEVLPTIADGTLLVNTPLGGPNGIRDKLYRKGGFGRVQVYEEGNQYAIVRNGELIPLEFGKPHRLYFEDKSISKKDRRNWNFNE